jgi:hypothetical protein
VQDIIAGSGSRRHVVSRSKRILAGFNKMDRHVEPVFAANTLDGEVAKIG